MGMETRTDQFFVVCTNPDHNAQRFTSRALAESYVEGHRMMAMDVMCANEHRIINAAPACQQLSKELAMEGLGALLESVMPDPDDSDECENGLSVREVGAIIDADEFADQFCTNPADDCACDFHRDAAGLEVFSMRARREMGFDL